MFWRLILLPSERLALMCWLPLPVIPILDEPTSMRCFMDIFYTDCYIIVGIIPTLGLLYSSPFNPHHVFLQLFMIYPPTLEKIWLTACTAEKPFNQVLPSILHKFPQKSCLLYRFLKRNTWRSWWQQETWCFTWNHSISRTFWNGYTSPHLVSCLA